MNELYSIKMASARTLVRREARGRLKKKKTAMTHTFDKKQIVLDQLRASWDRWEEERAIISTLETHLQQAEAALRLAEQDLERFEQAYEEMQTVLESCRVRFYGETEEVIDDFLRKVGVEGENNDGHDNDGEGEGGSEDDDPRVD